jgi:hypothetical protein
VSETTSANGDAFPVTAVAGPPMSPVAELAQARADAAHADLVIEQVRAKLARSVTDGEIADARQALEDAVTEAAAAHLKAHNLGKETGG